METDSAADTGRGISSPDVALDEGVGSSHGESMSSSVAAVVSGEGDSSGRVRSLAKLKGALWGRGEISMESGGKQGDDEGIGGVVTPSHLTGGVMVPSTSELAVSTYSPSRCHCRCPWPCPGQRRRQS